MNALTEHFSWEEATHTDVGLRLGLDNVPPIELRSNIAYTADQMEIVRAGLGFPITVLSWYRSPEVNLAVGSGPGSQHLLGEAVDFICPQFGDALAVCRRLRDLRSTIRFDQLIYEFRWVHISWTRRKPPRMEVLTIRPGSRRGVFGLPGDLP